MITRLAGTKHTAKKKHLEDLQQIKPSAFVLI